MFEYLRSAPSPVHSDGIFVFGRCDKLVAYEASRLFVRGMGRYLLVTGGVGKDSGWLTPFQIPEAHFLATILVAEEGIPSEALLLEPSATNGGENCRLGLDVIGESGEQTRRLVVVSHPTQLRRLMAVLQAELGNRKLDISLSGSPTGYRFKPSSPGDQHEAVHELLRLADWPAKGWSVPQDDLPEDLVEFARARKQELWPDPV